jgi:MFS transporter, BCD family, chlorophyll transporter
MPVKNCGKHVKRLDFFINFFMISDNLVAEQPHVLPEISMITMIRLGLFQVALGMMSVLIFGVLNRILIKELNVPGTIATLVLAMTLFVAPARVWFGQMSDTKPFFGHYRTGYVWAGAAGLSITVIIAVQVMWKLGDNVRALGSNDWTPATYGWALLLGLVFGLYGLSVSASSTPFATLLVDVTDENNRSKIVAIDWSMLLMGVIIGAITISRILKPLESNASIENVQIQVNHLFMIVPIVVCFLAVIATWGVEKKYSRFAQRQQPAESGVGETVGLKRAWRILNTSRQTKIFFTFLVFMTLGLFMQDAVLETYGGQVFGMSIGESAQLNAFFGTGTVVGLLLTGFFLIPKIGKQRSARWGCSLVAFSMLWVIAAGFTQNVMFLKMALLFFGLFSGVVTTSALTLMLDLTLPETAGTFIGAWGLSQALAKGIATILGGALLDIGKKIFGATSDFSNNLVLAYGLVFALQAVVMLVAIRLLGRVNINEFKVAGGDAVKAAIELGD